MKKLLAMLLAVVMVLSLVACATTDPNPTKPGNETKPTTPSTPADTQPSTPAATDPSTPGAAEVPSVDVTPNPVYPGYTGDTYEREDEEEIYNYALSEFLQVYEAAKELDNISARFAMMAKAEAMLLDAAVFVPNTTAGGSYTISRVAPRTVPYVQWGNDTDRLKGLVISDEFLTPAERNDLMDMWKKATAGEGTYDPAAYLTGKGHTLQKVYNTTFSTAPVTLDWLNTSSQADTEITVNTVDGLVEYDNLNVMRPALAESWSISEDGLTYTFNIRKGAYWVTSDGQQFAEVTAQDFVAGFNHMLDTAAGLEWLVEGVVAGVSEYLYDGGSFDDVGYAVGADKYTLVITLEAPTSYFMTMLTYSCFLPICDSFYQSRGGVYGIEEYAEASGTDSYRYGVNTDVASQVYCGPFRITKLDAASEITLVANDKYWNKDAVTLESLKWIYDDGGDLNALYNATINGTYAGIGVSNATLNKLAKDDGRFEKYAYVSDTNSTTYFGALNLNRGTHVLTSGGCASNQTEAQKISAHVALQNKNFRQALGYAWDRATMNAVSRGDELKTTNLRNMYTHPEFVSITEDVVIDGHTFAAGTFYGEMVQYFCDQLGLKVDVKDGVDGWYNAANAKAAFEKAKAELGDSVTYPIQIDVVYYGASTVQVGQANAYKASIEGALGAENVQVNLIEATTTDDYYASGYRAAHGVDANYEMFYGSGWGPDYGDPSTYLDTFLPFGAGYMTKTLGLF